MLYFVSTAKQLREALDALIEAFGEDTPVGNRGPMPDFIEGDLQITCVVVDKRDGLLIGSHKDQEPKADQCYVITVE